MRSAIPSGSIPTPAVILLAPPELLHLFLKAHRRKTQTSLGMPHLTNHSDYGENKPIVKQKPEKIILSQAGIQWLQGRISIFRSRAGTETRKSTVARKITMVGFTMPAGTASLK